MSVLHQGQRNRLTALLSVSSTILQDEVHTRYQSVIGECDTRVVLFGTGHLGRYILRGLRAAGIEPFACTDNNPNLHGKEFDGLQILPPAFAFDQFGQEAAFVPAVFTYGPLVAQLHEAGVRILPVPVLFWHFPKVFLPFASLTLPDAILAAKADVLAGLDRWDESLSREEYVAQIAWRTSLDPSVLPPHLPQDQIYFADDLFEMGTEEVVVDCGAFDGDTLRAVLGKTSSFRRYLAAEPDSANRIRLEATIQSLEPSLRPRCSILPYALGPHAGSITFHQTGTAGSSISDAGSIEIPMESLDHLLAGVNPTFIKMDIEGAELATLTGAREVIQRAMPILAICLYHRPTDLWEIPRLIKEIAPSYHLFLRRYCNDQWEQVCYAVPPERLKHPAINPQS